MCTSDPPGPLSQIWGETATIFCWESVISIYFAPSGETKKGLQKEIVFTSLSRDFSISNMFWHEQVQQLSFISNVLIIKLLVLFRRYKLPYFSFFVCCLKCFFFFHLTLILTCLRKNEGKSAVLVCRLSLCEYVLRPPSREEQNFSFDVYCNCLAFSFRHTILRVRQAIQRNGQTELQTF